MVRPPPPSLVGFVVGLGLAAASASASSASSSSAASSSSSPSSPLLLLPSSPAGTWVHRRLVSDLRLGDVASPSDPPSDDASDPHDPASLRRRIQSVDPTDSSSTAPACPTDCPCDPFLWKIAESSTGKHVGFALGTMQLPLDLVVASDAERSILAAVEDVCDVYGEVNLHRPNATVELRTCTATAVSTSATVSDLPDGTLKSSIASKMDEVAALLSPDDAAVAKVFAERLLTLPLPEVQRIVLYANTPEYAEAYLSAIYSGMGPAPLDAHVMSLGRPANGLGDLSTECEVINAAHKSAEELAADLGTYEESIRASLDASLSREIELYRCGDVSKFASALADGMAIDDDVHYLGDKNADLAAKIDEVLKSNPDERVLFAVGVGRWTLGGDGSLTSYLEGRGYALEHVPEWAASDAEDHTNDHCKVLYHPSLGFTQTEAVNVEGLATPEHDLIKDTIVDLGDNATDEVVAENLDPEAPATDASEVPEEISGGSFLVGPSRAMAVAVGAVWLGWLV